MKKLFAFISGIVLLAFTLPEKKKIKIFLAGDSTVQRMAAAPKHFSVKACGSPL